MCDGQPFTLQQMQGGPRYQHNCRIGNWQEDQTLEAIRRHGHKQQVKSGKLLLNVIKDRMSKALTPCDLTVLRDDGFVHYGDLLMFHSIGTNSFLAGDLQDKDPRPGEIRYTCTGSPDPNPVARNTFYIDKCDLNCGDDILRYGEPFKIRINPRLRGLARDNQQRIVNEPLYVSSTHISLGNHSKKAHKCEVALTPKDDHETAWEAHIANPSQRFEYEGMPVRAGEGIVLHHRGTNQKLCALNRVQFKHSTDFGEEYELCGWTQTTGGHQALMAKEMAGEFGTINASPNRPSNHWHILTGTMVSAEQPSVTMVDMESVLAKIQEAIGNGSVNAVKNLGRALRSGDARSAGLVPFAHFMAAMNQVGLNLTAGEASALSDTYSTNQGFAYISFLVAVRGNMPDYRLHLVRKTFHGLIQMGSTGLVSLKEAVSNFDPAPFPRVRAGEITPEDFFRAVADVFQGATEHLNLEEWEEYFEEISAACNSDEAFSAVASECWGLHEDVRAQYSVEGPGTVENLMLTRAAAEKLDFQRTNSGLLEQ
jgi:hypothetical protein